MLMAPFDAAPKPVKASSEFSSPVRNTELVTINKTRSGQGLGPLKTRDRETAKCTNLAAVYGPKELHAAVAPVGVLVLWGTKLKLDGLDILLDGRQVGRVVWVE